MAREPAEFVRIGDRMIYKGERKKVKDIAFIDKHEMHIKFTDDTWDVFVPWEYVTLDPCHH